MKENSYSQYIHKVCLELDIHGPVNIEFVDDIGSCAGYTLGDTNSVDIVIGRKLDGVELSEEKMHKSIAHELVHAKQLLSGELYKVITNPDHVDGPKFKWVYKDVDYIDVNYKERPWEIEAYRLQEELYNLCQ